jgi:hypothetical protein
MAWMLSDTKYCPSCHTRKPLEDFPRRSDNKHKRRSKCKACTNKIQSVWRERIEPIPEWDREDVLRNAQKEIQFSEWLDGQGVALTMHDWLIACQHVMGGAAYGDALRAVRLVNMDYPEAGENAVSAAAV